MRVTLQLFAAARQRAGRSSVELELPEPASVAELKASLGREIPELSTFVASLRFAVNEEYADDSTPIPIGATLAAIPPVSGGAEFTSSPWVLR